jgi:hypothetical protein
MQAAEHLAAMCKGLADMERRFAGHSDWMLLIGGCNQL